MTEKSETVSGDRRVRRTRAAIQDALTALILDKGFDSVTVTDIIEKADIGRSTFYAHFTDKRDVFDDIISELTQFLAAGSAQNDQVVFAFSLPLFEHIVDQKPVISALFGPGGHSVALQMTSDALSSVISGELRERCRAKPVSPEQLALVVDFVVGAFTSMIAHWMASPTPYSPKELDTAFRALVVPGVERMLGLVPAAP